MQCSSGNRNMIYKILHFQVGHRDKVKSFLQVISKENIDDVSSNRNRRYIRQHLIEKFNRNKRKEKLPVKLMSFNSQAATLIASSFEDLCHRKIN